MDRPPNQQNSRSQRRRNPPGGFTLIEVVLAIFIALSLLVVALFFYQQTARLRGDLITESERLASVRMVMNRLTSELRTAFPLSTSHPPLLGSSNFIQIVKTDLPSRTAWSGAGSERTTLPDTDLRLVTYRLESLDGTNTAGLLRSEQPMVQFSSLIGSPHTSFSPSASNAASNQWTAPVIGQIRFMRFRYFDGTDWRDSWTGPALPRGVEMILSDQEPSSQAQPESPPEFFRRVVYLPCGSSTAGIAFGSSPTDSGNSAFPDSFP